MREEVWPAGRKARAEVAAEVEAEEENEGSWPVAAGGLRRLLLLPARLLLPLVAAAAAGDGEGAPAVAAVAAAAAADTHMKSTMPRSSMAVGSPTAEALRSADPNRR